VPAAVVEVEVTVNVAVAADVPTIVTGVVTVQVGTLAPLAGVTTQPRATAPVNPPAGVTVMVDVPVAPPDASVIGPLSLSAIEPVGTVVPPFCVVAIATEGA
jgi:hypothetical protein